MKVNTIFELTVEEKLEFIGATLLSAEEAENYLTREERVYDFYWWLRSPGCISSYVAYVDSDGSIDYSGDHISLIHRCVRPALQIKNLESSYFEIGDRFKMGGYEFKIISKDLAWMYKQDIGCYAFNEDFEKGNDYERSDAKNFVDKWFECLKVTF